LKYWQKNEKELERNEEIKEENGKKPCLNDRILGVAIFRSTSQTFGGQELLLFSLCYESSRHVKTLYDLMTGEARGMLHFTKMYMSK
jgi:hypothetical protein